MTRPQNVHVCFVALNCYTLLSRRADIEHTGGAELQQTLIARELARRGHRVTFVTADHGQTDGITHDGIQVFKTCGKNDGLPLLRFVHPRWTSLNAAMRRAGAEVYYQRTGGLETGQVALWCRSNRRKFVFAAAVDYDCRADTPHLKDRRSRLLYRAGLRRAERVVTQTDEQQALLAREFHLDSTVIRSCGIDPGESDLPLRAPDPPRLLWLGRFTPQKGLERLLDLAEACPELIFDLIGNPDADTDYAREIRTRAARLPNVSLLGWIPNSEVDRYYRRSALLVCTSHFEGFPNTFIEAWARGIPVASTLDPDGLLVRHELGCVGHDVPDLAQQIRALLGSDSRWATRSRNARRHFESAHAVSVAADAYERLFQQLQFDPQTDGTRRRLTAAAREADA